MVINLEAVVLRLYSEAQCAARAHLLFLSTYPGLAAALQTVFVKYR
jgi:hypothetical protein